MTIAYFFLPDSGKNKYIQNIKLNNQPYTFTFLRHTDLMRGGLLEIEMGAKPSATYGVKEEMWPTSMSH